MFSRGGAGLFCNDGLAGSEKAGKEVSGREKPDEVGCRVLGDGFFSIPASPNPRVGVDDANGEGRLCVGGSDVCGSGG